MLGKIQAIVHAGSELVVEPYCIVVCIGGYEAQKYLGGGGA